ncbi:acyl-CoA dehydrogenase family protein [Georgenia sp. AZ-5]|uniref:acyl-CoA dehydrogenase family protein n=1 Tax=Georgenia sp. AZ-5 TaxID=3367526 RepID=UPI00375489EE
MTIDVHPDAPAYQPAFTEDEDAFRELLRDFLDREVEPVYATLATDSETRHALFRKAGDAGLLGTTVPEEYGGMGATPIFNMIISHELAKSHAYGTVGSLFCTDLATGLLVDGGTPELINEWAPKIIAGEAIQCMAATEADAGSDVLAIRTTAKRDGDNYVLSGAKTFITNGDVADIIYVVARTAPERRGRSLSMFLVDGASAGITRRKLRTMGFPLGNTAELYFDDVVVPAGHLLGGEGGAMRLLMGALAYDRLQISARALGQAELAFQLTLEHVRQRQMFGQTLGDYQVTQFAMAEMKTEIEVGRTMLEDIVRKVRSGISSEQQAAMAKLWVCEMSGRVLDRCMQLFGGMGFMDESPISRIYTSNRVLRVYGGTSETMKQAIARAL